MKGKGTVERIPVLRVLIDEERIIELHGSNENAYMHIMKYECLKKTVQLMLNEYHSNYNLRIGMPTEEFRKKIFYNSKGAFTEQIIKAMEADKAIMVKRSMIRLYDFEVKLNETQSKIRKELNEIIEADDSMPVDTEEIMNRLKRDKEKEVWDVINMMIEREEVKRLKDNMLFSREYFDRAVNLVEDYIKQKGCISVAVLRDILNTSRRYAIALLEEMDRLKITKRLGDYRELNN